MRKQQVLYKATDILEAHALIDISLRLPGQEVIEAVIGF